MPADTVAQVCGLSLYVLDNSFRPPDWASPRDFTLTKRGLLYSEASLPQLASYLEACLQREPARKLREYIQKIATVQETSIAAYADLPPGKLVAVERVDANAEQLDQAAARHTRRHASEREQLPAGWAADWEAAHDNP